jgi:hypothetical protein
MLARSVLFAAFAALLVTTGCNEKERIVALDLPPHRVVDVYSVTGDRVVTVHWDANQEDDIDHYRVYRNRSVTGTFTFIGSSPGITYEDRAVANGETYFYAVAAVDRAGQESAELSRENVHDTPRPEGFNVTLTDPDLVEATSAWNFAARARCSWLDGSADIYYDYDAGVTGGHYLLHAKTGVLIQDAGLVDLVDVSFGPPADAGWSADGVVEAIPGHSYIVLTPENHYAKFGVVARDGAGMRMNWAYQIDPDNPELARRLP